MGIINLCFSISGNTLPVDVTGQQFCFSESFFDAGFEQQYQSGLKQIISFFYKNSTFPVSVSFSGGYLEWLARKHKEVLILLSEMTGRKQIEPLGGAYYYSLLPALLPMDRVGQIELMTTAVRQYIGKRPRGMRLPNNAWEASLIPSLKTCGMEFVLADKNLIPADKTPFLPYIIQDQGKNIYVLAEHTDISSDVSPEVYLSELQKQAAQYCGDADRPVVCQHLTVEQTCNLIQSGWLEELINTVTSALYATRFELTLPSRYVKATQHFQRAYIPAGVYVEQEHTVYNLYDYLLKSPDTYLLYAKMMYVSMLVNQSRNDKTRKKTAREQVWKGQAGTAYMPFLSRTITDIHQQYAYHYLLQAERTVREYINFFDSVTTFDYDSDGVREYICQFEQFNAYIQARGGSVFEFDVLAVARNYAMISPGHTGLFLDYLIEPDNNSRPDIFARQIYREAGFDSKRHEIKFYASGVIGEFNQSVMLKKNYCINSTGIQVQYILKNDSPFPLRQIFAVESNMMLPSVSSRMVKIEVIAGENKEPQSAGEATTGGTFSDVSLIRFSDNDVSFIFEMNENASFRYTDSDGHLSVIISWMVEIPPSLEIEKMISFSAIPRNYKKRISRKPKHTG